MTTVTAFVKQHPVATYFALVFAISWGGILIVVGPGGYPGTAGNSRGSHRSGRGWLEKGGDLTRDERIPP